MAYTTNRKFSARIQQLVWDGFLGPNATTGELQLTNKGLAVLLAEADRPLVKLLVKPTLKSERKAAANFAGRFKTRDNYDGKDREDA